MKVKPAWEETCGYLGGEIANHPRPLVRRWPNPKRIKRRVRVNIYTWVGIGVGAKHTYAVLTEEFNPLWDWNNNRWVECWDDREGKGRQVEAEFAAPTPLERERRARAWVRQTVRRNFRNHLVVKDGDTKAPWWYRTSQREGD